MANKTNFALRENELGRSRTRRNILYISSHKKFIYIKKYNHSVETVSTAVGINIFSCTFDANYYNQYIKHLSKSEKMICKFCIRCWSHPPNFRLNVSFSYVSLKPPIGLISDKTSHLVPACVSCDIVCTFL